MDFVLTHWPIIAYCLIAATATQVMKGLLWTKTNVEKGGKTGALLWWGRKTLPLQPVLPGVILGLIPGMPASPGVETVAAKCLYFAVGGVICTWVFDAVKGLFKSRAGFVPDGLPGATPPTQTVEVAQEEDPVPEETAEDTHEPVDEETGEVVDDKP